MKDGKDFWEKAGTNDAAQPPVDNSVATSDKAELLEGGKDLSDKAVDNNAAQPPVNNSAVTSNFSPPHDTPE